MSTRRNPYTWWLGTSLVAIGIWGVGITVVAVPPDAPRSTNFLRRSPMTDADVQPTSTPQGTRNINSERSKPPTSGRGAGRYNLYSSASLAATGGDDCNDAPVAAVTIGAPGNPNTTTITGDTTLATGPECDPGLRAAWWEAFELDKCANVIIDFCATLPTILRPNYVVVGTDCAEGGKAGPCHVPR